VPDKVGGACVEAMVVAVRPSRAGGAGGVGRRRRRLSAVN